MKYIELHRQVQALPDKLQRAPRFTLAWLLATEAILCDRVLYQADDAAMQTKIDEIVSALLGQLTETNKVAKIAGINRRLKLALDRIAAGVTLTRRRRKRRKSPCRAI